MINKELTFMTKASAKLTFRTRGSHMCNFNKLKVTFFLATVKSYLEVLTLLQYSAMVY